MVQSGGGGLEAISPIRVKYIFFSKKCIEYGRVFEKVVPNIFVHVFRIAKCHVRR